VPAKVIKNRLESQEEAK